MGELIQFLPRGSSKSLTELRRDALFGRTPPQDSGLVEAASAILKDIGEDSAPSEMNLDEPA